MSRSLTLLTVVAISFLSLPVHGQVTAPAKDSSAKAGTDSVSMKDSSLAKTTVDTVRVVVDTIVKKDCYTEYYDIMRARGAKPVTDGMQQVVIALKNADACHCLLGQIEVSGGKIKPPLYFLQESGEYKLVSALGKKLEPAFAASMTNDELYSIREGMSIVFRTVDNEYGRLFFYKFVNKGTQSYKSAPAPSELMKE